MEYELQFLRTKPAVNIHRLTHIYLYVHDYTPPYTHTGQLEVELTADASTNGSVVIVCTVRKATVQF